MTGIQGTQMMTRRIQVTLNGPDTSKIGIVPEAIQHIEVEELSVEKWSEAAVEEMFNAADDALKETAKA